MSLSKSELFKLLDNCTSGVVLVDPDNVPIYSNSIFSKYSDSFRQKVLSHNASNSIEGFNIRSSQIDENTAFFIDKSLYQNDQLFGKMLDKIHNSDDIFHTLVEEIHNITGWRWIMATRFIDAATVQVLSFWNTNEHNPSMTYLLKDTPCEVMARNKKFTLFTDVAKSFTKNEMLSQLGAKAYAGLVYYGEEQQAIGHIMCMHDSNDVDYKFMEDVIKLASLVVSSKLLLLQTQEQLKTAVSLSNIDGLTKLKNRKMFDKLCGEASQQFINNDINSIIAIIDLNKFKLYNDTFGHPKGDTLLKLFSTELTKLGRVSDHCFRLGGDEFAILLPDSTPESLQRIQQQFHEAMHRISLMLGQAITASIGFASMTEVAGNIQQCYELADQRMYQHKAEFKY